MGVGFVTAWTVGSTLASPALAPEIHSDLPAAVMPEIGRPGVNVAPRFREVASIPVIVLSSRFATHTDPAAWASGPGRVPTATALRSRRLLGSITATELAATCTGARAARGEQRDHRGHAAGEGERRLRRARLVAADDREASRPAAGGGRGAAGGVERGVLSEDRVVQLAQRGAGLHPQLVDEQPACLAVQRQRLGFAPAAIQREHPRGAQALAQRVLGR